MQLRNNFGEDPDGFLQLILSREDISNVVGTATESCIRMISEFKKSGFIRTSGKKIGIKDERSLMELADGLL